MHDKILKNIEELIRDNKFSDAEAFCRGYLSKNSYDHEVRLELAHILELSGEWDDALAELLFIKQSGTAHSNLSVIEAMMERVKEKKGIYEKVKSVIKGKKDFVSYIGNSDFVTLNKEGISISFHIKDHTLHMEEIFRAIKRAQTKIQQLTNWDIQKVNIEIYNDTEGARGEQLGIKQNSWIAGIYKGTIQIYKYPDVTEPQYIYTVITHEYAHLVVQAKLNEICPWWLNEGFAIYFSQSLSDNYKSVLLKAIKNSATIPFESLEDNRSLNHQDDLARLSYAQSASAVEYLFNKYGQEFMAKMFFRSLKQKGIAYALNSIGLNYYLLERDLIRWLKSENPSSS